jgi:transcriptional regulator with XRE-family HTH domain
LFGYDNFLCRPSAISFDVTRHRPYPTVSPPYAGFWMRTFQASNKKLWRSLVDTDEERIALGVEIRRMRVARGWTKTEFGQALGFTPPESGQVTKLENGRRRVFTHEMLDVFDLAFQVESGYFGRFLANLRGEPMSHRFFPELVRVRAACRASARLVVMHALGQLSREHYEVTVRRAGQCGAMRLYYHSRADFPGDSRFVAPFETVLERQYQVLMLEPATISASV